ncbi:MAG: hypothetical protein LBE83_04475 [Propionibacteriaceae bacterium]|nr:hypothetical protein [Propionibacteriaceae bacterium]
MQQAVSKPTRLLLYVHFNRFDRVEDYVVYQLQQLKPLFDTVVVISNSPVSPADRERFDGLSDHFLQRENIGFDFAAWRDGLNLLGWDEIVGFDELTIMNDTCFGPLHDFSRLYDEMQSRNVDFWGITTNVGLFDLITDTAGRHVEAPEHIQSYYVTFNQAVVRSAAFKQFWTSVKDHRTVSDAINDSEIRLTAWLVQHGFTFAAYHDAAKYWGKAMLNRYEVDVTDYRAGDMTKYNPGYACVRPLWLLETNQDYPFIKTKALSMVTEQVEGLRQWVINQTSYPIELIDNYLVTRFHALTEQKDARMLAAINSRSFRVGHFVTAPYRFARFVIRTMKSALTKPRQIW